jgi:hypothetical protein
MTSETIQGLAKGWSTAFYCWQEQTCFSSSPGNDDLCGAPNHTSEVFFRFRSARTSNWAFNLHAVPKLKFRGGVTLLPVHLHGVVPNNSSTWDLFTDILQTAVRGWFGYYNTLCDPSERKTGLVLALHDV